jgi:hypothetical protein
MTVVCTQAQLAEALLDPLLPCPQGLRAWNGSDPARRLAVYRNNVRVSLVDALADTFPVVRQLVGEDFFRAMAALFVREQPPRSRVLAHYGDALPGFIEGFAPADPVPYLADVARLEFARVLAYHAADDAPVQPDAVLHALASGERIGELRLRCHPSLWVRCSAHALVSIWAAHQHDDGLASVDATQPEDALVLRSGLDVLVQRAPVGAVEFIQALHQGLSYAEAALAATARCPRFEPTATLALLFEHGALCAIHLSQEATS